MITTSSLKQHPFISSLFCISEVHHRYHVEDITRLKSIFWFLARPSYSLETLPKKKIDLINNKVILVISRIEVTVVEFLSTPRGCLNFLPCSPLHLQAGNGAQIFLVPQLSDCRN